MALIAHIAAGLASKPFYPKVPVLMSIVACEILDILCIPFRIFGLERSGYIPWSHSLTMSILWSVISGFVVKWLYSDNRMGIFVGSLIFIHWIIDLITHPMGVVLGGQHKEPDLPLFFGNSLKVGLGLYNHSILTVYITEFGSLALGVMIYIFYRRKISGVRPVG